MWSGGRGERRQSTHVRSSWRVSDASETEALEPRITELDRVHLVSRCNETLEARSAHSSCLFLALPLGRNRLVVVSFLVCVGLRFGSFADAFRWRSQDVITVPFFFS